MARTPPPVSSLPGTGNHSLVPPSGDMNHVVVSSAANSSPSVGASSQVTDANSALSGGPQLQRSVSFNTDSYLRLPASPMSFSSNNFSGSSVMDGSSIVQQTSQQEMAQKRGGSCVTSQPTVNEHPGSQFHLQKKMRMDLRQEDMLQQQMIHQLLRRQDSIHLQGHPSALLQAATQQPRLVHRQQMQQQQQMPQALPLMHRAQVNQQQQQMRPHVQQQVVPPAPPVRRSVDGLCTRRMLQYMFHQRSQESSISYWRKFVLEYFSPRARKRWCLSMDNSVGNHPVGVFTHAATETLHCGICGSKSGKGFEATFEVLPRLYQIKFDHGVVDELLYLDRPHESLLPSGMLLLEYAKAVQETVYEQLRVIHEGHLRIIFSQELKIVSWDFCIKRHEEFFPRRLVAPQVNQLLQVAQKYQDAIAEKGSTGVDPQDLHANCNMFAAAGRQIARNLESQPINDMGFSKRFVRCLQISDVVSSMKDLIDCSQQNMTGPIESLKNYSQQAMTKLRKQKAQEMEQLFAATQCLPSEQGTSSKAIGSHPGQANSFGGDHAVASQTAVGMGHFQNLLRSSVTMPNRSSLHSDSASSSSNGPVQGQQGLHFHGIPGNANTSQMNHQQQIHQQVIQQMLAMAKGAKQQPRTLPQPMGNAAMAPPADGGVVAGTMVAPARVSGPVRQGAVATSGTVSIPPSSSLGPMLPSQNGSTFGLSGAGSTASGGSGFKEVAEGSPLPELDQDIDLDFGGEDGVFDW